MSSTAFQALFGAAPQGTASAPGRVNLIGEFTDYNGGWVLPLALPFRCRVDWQRRDDETVSVRSREYPESMDSFNSQDEYSPGEQGWANYVRAVVAALRESGRAPGGMNLLISSDVPQGRGLSSSAALEVALLGAFASAFNWPLDQAEIAALGQRAENRFIGCQCGIMDQLVSAAAQPGTALQIDCQSLATEDAGIPEHWAIVVLDSNHPRQLVDSEYNLRRQDCEAAADTMGLSSLREATPEELGAHRSEMTPGQFSRALHVVEENQRVLASAQALRTGQLTELAALLARGHQSLVELFEVTVPATDALVAIAKNALGNRVAARQTGGGFGGAVVCICEHDDVELLLAAVQQHYHQQTGLEATPFVCTPGRGLESVIYE